MSDPERRSFTLDGRRLTLTETGSGPLLVCVPGGPGLPGTHLGNLGGLDASRTLLRPDWRGAGLSDPPASDGHRLVDYAGDLEAVREFLGLEEFDLLAHSFGGLVAVTYAAIHPARVPQSRVRRAPRRRRLPPRR